jgi:hypothetical protein
VPGDVFGAQPAVLDGRVSLNVQFELIQRFKGIVTIDANAPQVIV